MPFQHAQPQDVRPRPPHVPRPQSTVIPDDGSWTPGTRNTERDYQLSAPLPVPANTPCILEVQGSGTATDSYFEFNKFSELETGAQQECAFASSQQEDARAHSCCGNRCTTASTTGTRPALPRGVRIRCWPAAPLQTPRPATGACFHRLPVAQVLSPTSIASLQVRPSMWRAAAPWQWSTSGTPLGAASAGQGRGHAGSGMLPSWR